MPAKPVNKKVTRDPAPIRMAKSGTYRTQSQAVSAATNHTRSGGEVVVHRPDGSSHHKIKSDPAAPRTASTPELDLVEPAAAQIDASLRELLALVRAGKRPTDVLRSDAVSIVPPSEYDAAGVRAVREAMGVSQAVFAALLAVSPELVQHWEQGIREPRGPARRLLDAAASDPAGFFARLVQRTIKEPNG